MLKFSQKLSNVYNPFKIYRKCSKVIRTSLDIFSNIQKFFENRRKSSEVAGMFLEIPVMTRRKSHTFHSDKVGRYTVAIDIIFNNFCHFPCRKKRRKPSGYRLCPVHHGRYCFWHYLTWLLQKRPTSLSRLLQKSSSGRMYVNFILYCAVQKISLLPPQKVFCFAPPVPPENSSLALYFASKILTFKTPSPQEFPMTMGWPGMDFFWDCTLFHTLKIHVCDVVQNFLVEKFSNQFDFCLPLSRIMEHVTTMAQRKIKVNWFEKF